MIGTCGRAAGHHPPRRQDDHRGSRGDRAASSVIVRKAYGAGLYAMAGPGFEPDACIALPTAKIAVMGPRGGGQRRYAGKIAEIADPNERDAFRRRPARGVRTRCRPHAIGGRSGHADAVIPPRELRAEIVQRYRARWQGPGRRREAARRSADVTSPETADELVIVRGHATDEEVAVVLASPDTRARRPPVTGTSTGAPPGWLRSTSRHPARCADIGIADEPGHEIGKSLRVPTVWLMAGSGEQGQRAPGQPGDAQRTHG